MLNRDQLQELGRFKLLMRRACQETVHIETFLTDRNYQSKMLDMAEDQDEDELLLMLAVTLRGRLGRLGEGEEAFEQICPKIALNAAPVVAEASDAVMQPIVDAVMSEPVAAPAIPAESPVVAERAAVRTRSVLSSLFSTSANSRAGGSPTAGVDNTPRYVNSLR